METLVRSIGVARRRMILEHWFRLMPRWIAAAVVAVAIALVAGKFWAWGLVWWAWLAGGVAIGIVASAVHAVLRRPSPLAAALEIDRRFDLDERVSSAWSLGPAARQTPVGQAVLDDACRHVTGLSLSDRFGVLPDRRAWVPLAPALATLLLALLVGPWNRSEATAEASSTVQPEAQRSTDQLRKKLIEQRREAREHGLKDAELLLQQLEQRSEKLANEVKQNPKQSLIRLNELAHQVRERQKQLASDAVKQQLRQLKNLGNGPADRFAQAMRRGNVKQAIEELEKLKQQLAQKQLSEQQRQQLMSQLDKMANTLKQFAESQKQARKQLEKQMAEAQAAGREEEAERLKEQLEQLDQQIAQQSRMQELASQAEQCAACLNQGDASEAIDRLTAMQATLDDLERELQESALLDEVLDQIGQCKQCMGGLGVGGKGGTGEGLGEGRGRGNRPEAESETKSYDTRVRQRVGRGTSTLTDLVEGPNRKGQVEQQIATEFENARHEASAPVTTQRLPREYREQTKGYFDALLEAD